MSHARLGSMMRGGLGGPLARAHLRAANERKSSVRAPLDRAPDREAACRFRS